MVISEESVKYSLKNLTQKKTRSFLTILSIFIGITAIFIFVSFGVGLYDYVDQFVTETSADKITIMSKGVGLPGLDDTFALTEDDIDAIEQTSGVFETAPLYAKAAELQQDKIKKYTFLVGYDPEIPLVFEVADIGVYKGRELKKGDSGKVVLGYNFLVKDKIFPKAYDINSKIEIQGQDFRVVGFYESVGNPQDDSQIYMSIDDFEELYDDIGGYTWVIAEVDKDDIDGVVNRVERNLRKSRDLDKGKEDFFVQSWKDLLETYSVVLNGIIGFVLLIALVSVIVSVINTSNTMITSVLERVREIGVMKAIGAKNSEIFKLFLFESATLGLIAGIFGIALGWLITRVSGIILLNLGWGFLQPHYSWPLFMGLLLFATLTGAISGAIPAYQASKTNPVDALRYE